MTEIPMDDSASMHSNDSNNDINNTPAAREKLENLILQEAKHSHNYYDLHARDNFSKLDLENLNNSCQRYEDQKKVKCELLESYRDKLLEAQKNNANYLTKKLSSVVEELEQINSSFCEAYNDYSSDVLRNTVNYLVNETATIEEKLLKITEESADHQCMINELLMKPKSNLISNVDVAINILSESTMKRPEIELEEICSRLENDTIPNLKKSFEKLKKLLSVNN